MKLTYLRDFLAVAEAGSLRGAARKLKLSQPAISKSIASLEHELDSPLFHRHARGISLTDAGRAYQVHARAAIEELRRGQDVLAEMRANAGGSIAFGISASPSMLLLPDALQGFRQRYPTSAVRIVGGVLSIMLPELRDGILDFSIGPRPNVALGSEFTLEWLFTHECVVVARRGHPLADSNTLAQLLEAKWLVGGATSLDTKEHRAVFQSYGMEPPAHEVKCEYLQATLSLLIFSDFVTMLPRVWTESPIFSGLLMAIPVKEVLPAAHICAIRRRGVEPTPAAEHMLDQFRRLSAMLSAPRVPGPAGR